MVSRNQRALLAFLGNAQTLGVEAILEMESSAQIQGLEILRSVLRRAEEVLEACVIEVEDTLEANEPCRCACRCGLACRIPKGQEHEMHLCGSPECDEFDGKGMRDTAPGVGA